jgi:hypothetical protein
MYKWPIGWEGLELARLWISRKTYNVEDYRLEDNSFMKRLHTRELANYKKLFLKSGHPYFRLVAELCVIKKLPAGDPCWMAKLICSYI